MLTTLVLSGALTLSCAAAPNLSSRSNDFSENPFIAVGVDPATKVVTGYFSALLTAPGKTEECKFSFQGNLTPEGNVRLSIKDAVVANIGKPAEVAGQFATLAMNKSTVKIELPTLIAPGDCEWVLESVGGPQITTGKDRFVLAINASTAADWIAVATIRSKRAFFHNAPDLGSVRKAFLVAGDVAYVIEEKAGWLHVKFTHGRKETSGWIKATDVLHF